MVKILKFLSVLTGSPEQTLLNARIEVTDKLGGGGALSSIHEKEFIFDKFSRDMHRMFTIEQCNRTLTADIVGAMLEEYGRRGEKEILNAFNRVMVYYYNYELGNAKTLFPALILFSKEFDVYIKKRYLNGVK